MLTSDRAAVRAAAGRAAAWWTSGRFKPQTPGPYERKTAFGSKLDMWDGMRWRRIGFRGVICANQNLPWRERSR